MEKATFLNLYYRSTSTFITPDTALIARLRFKVNLKMLQDISDALLEVNANQDVMDIELKGI